MISSIFTFVRLARQTLRGGESSASLAAGVTIGMMIGLLPGDSLVVALLALIAMGTSTNLFVAACSTIGFSWIGAFSDSLLHRIGALVLTHPSLQSTFTWAAEAPILPWTRFNNTIACGGMVLGLCLAYPVFYLSQSAIDRYAPVIHRKLIAYRVYRALAAIPAPTPEPSPTEVGATS